MNFDNETSVKKTQKPKGLIIALVIMVVLAIVGVAFGVFELIQNNQKSDEIAKLKETATVETVVKAPESVAEEETETETPKEVEITNGYVLRDLRHKVGILHGVNNRVAEKEGTLSAALAYNFISQVYTNTLNDAEKASITVRGEPRSAWQDPKYYTDGYYDKLRAFIDSDPVSAQWWGTKYNPSDIEYISYEAANDLYKQLFGNSENMDKANIRTNVCGQDYLYVSSTDGFIEAPAGCGGAGFPLVFVKIDSYKAKGSEAYVDVRTSTAFAADTNLTAYNLYDGLYYYIHEEGGNNNTTNLPESNSYKNGKILASVSPDITDDEVFSKYGDSIKHYRFVFKMNSDGVFYFSRVENL